MYHHLWEWCHGRVSSAHSCLVVVLVRTLHEACSPMFLVLWLLFELEVAYSHQTWLTMSEADFQQSISISYSFSSSLKQSPASPSPHSWTFLALAHSVPSPFTLSGFYRTNRSAFYLHSLLTWAISSEYSFLSRSFLSRFFFSIPAFFFDPSKGDPLPSVSGSSDLSKRDPACFLYFRVPQSGCRLSALRCLFVKTLFLAGYDWPA